jgi:hypothetical protein
MTLLGSYCFALWIVVSVVLVVVRPLSYFGASVRYSIV